MSIFSVEVKDKVNGKTYSVKGNEFKVENPKANLLIITGMNEYSARYKRFALDMNDNGISVYVMDHFGQGENAQSMERQECVPEHSWIMQVDAFHQKVEELKKEGLPVYIMGHSMGSFLIQAFLETYPHSTDKVIIMGSNGDNAKSLYGFANFLAKSRTNKKNWDKEDKLMEKASLGPYSKAIKDCKTDLDWLSYNEDNVKAYQADPYCGHFDTHGFFVNFMYGLNQLYKKENLKRISLEEHILIISGQDDPVGANGKGPESLAKLYQKLGVKDVTLKLYPHMRHEILNETNREEPVAFIKEFLSK